jgi:glutamyl-tRNA synthetase
MTKPTLPVPVGRIAPSPTGRLHLGHARTFLIAYWHTLSRGGVLHLRIDDLDAGRLRPGMVDATLEDLEWLGLEPNGLLLKQSTRLGAYRSAAEGLLRQGLAYPCTCTRSQLAREQSAPHAGEAELRYPGTCRGRFRSWDEALAAGGGQAALRFHVPEGEVLVADGLLGERHFEVAREVGDFVILRRDTGAAYQLATALDDAELGVTEVVRGADLLPSAARQQLLCAALGLVAPAFAHVPLVVEASGERLSKSSGSLSLFELRAQGVDPRAIVSWVARSAGVEVGGRLTAPEVIREFQLGLVPREPCRLDLSMVAR